MHIFSSTLDTKLKKRLPIFSACLFPQIILYSFIILFLACSGGEIVASNKTVTVGKHFTLFFKTTTLQGYLLPAFFSAILPPRVQFTTQKWFLEFPLYPFSISKTRYKAKAVSQNSEAFEAIIILGMTFMSHSKNISRIEKHLSHIWEWAARWKKNSSCFEEKKTL